MDNCGPICILFIWAGFLWPLIVSGFYLIIKKQQITSKGKFFLLSSFGGYVLLIGFNFLISFIARSFLGPDSEVEMKTLAEDTGNGNNNDFVYSPSGIKSCAVKKIQLTNHWRPIKKPRTAF